MRRPGRGARSPSSSWLNEAKNSYNATGSSIKEHWSRLSDSKGTSLIGKPALDFYGPSGLEREFTDSIGTFHRHHNAVDAFRHAYTSGVLYAEYGEFAVDFLTFEADDPAGLMDRANNKLGVQLYKEFVDNFGRPPTDDEFALSVIDSILEGRASIRDEGAPGWQERLQPQRDEMIERIWDERRERAEREHRGDPLPPRELERGQRPGFGDFDGKGPTMDA